MEDRFALVQIPVPHLPNENIVRLFCVMDGHGGQVRNTFHNMSDNISEFDFFKTTFHNTRFFLTLNTLIHLYFFRDTYILSKLFRTCAPS